MTGTRLATLDDLYEIQSLFRTTIQAVCSKDYSSEQLNIWVNSTKNIERWKGLILDQYFIVSTDNEKITGFCSLKNGHHLDLLYIHNDYQRKGLASVLYTEIKAESLRLGHQYLSADVSITAKPFFESKSFKVVKEQLNIIDGVEIINYKMSQQN